MTLSAPDTSAEGRHSLRLRCNGSERTLETTADRLLIDTLRQDLGLTGTKLGCGTGDCGACTVLLDGDAVNSCLVLTAECDGSAVETVEAVAGTPQGRALADALVAHDAVQCGICMPGILVTAAQFLRHASPAPAQRADVADALAGNLCRCTGYLRIIDAVLAADAELKRGAGRT